MSKIEDSNDLVVSYLALRRLIGVLGIGLPIAILLYFRFSHAPDLEVSISAYYHTTFRDIFVGVLCIVGAFMIMYKGYENMDTVLSRIAGICAIGVAMFPTSEGTIPGPSDPASVHIIGAIHFAAAGGLFITFAIMSIGIFTISKPTPETPTTTKQKRMRNWLYRICGIVILTCIAIKGAHGLIAGKEAPPWSPTFWLESICLFSFGLSWLVKGDTILRDQPEAAEDEEVVEAAVAG